MSELAIFRGGLSNIDFDSPEFQATATQLADKFNDGMKLLRERFRDIEDMLEGLNEAYEPKGARFNVSLSHYSRSYNLRDIETLIKEYKKVAWGVLADKLGVKNIMSTKKREEFEKQLANGDLPEVTRENIVSVIMGLCDQAKDFALEACREVFDILRPKTDYVTNKKYRVGLRVILGYSVERSYGSGKRFRVRYSNYGHSDAKLRAINSVFLVLDGKTPLSDGRGELIEAICNSENGAGETEYFKFRCYNNGNIHLSFKREDLVKALNMSAAGEAVIGDSEGVVSW